MKKTVALPACLFLLINVFGQQFRLAPPSMQYGSVFFKKQAVVKLDFREPGAVIRYTMNNTEPDEKSPLYTKPLIIIRNNTTLKARSFSKKYLPSATVEATFLQAGWPATVVDCTVADEKYRGGGAAALTDNRGGIAAAAAPEWLGFMRDTINVQLQLQQPQKVTEIVIDFLQAESSWIFMPSSVTAYAFNEMESRWQLLGRRQFSFGTPATATTCVFAGIQAAQAVTSKKILVKIVPLQNLPQWHDGKGQPAWVFMDEIKVY